MTVPVKQHKIWPTCDVRINSIPALVQIIAWSRPGDKPLSLVYCCVQKTSFLRNDDVIITHCAHWVGFERSLALPLSLCGSLCFVKLAPSNGRVRLFPGVAIAWTKHLTHWGRVTHISVGNLIIIGSDNGWAPGRRQAIIWTNAGLLLIRTLGTNFNEILSGIHTSSFRKLHLKMSSAKWLPFCRASMCLTWGWL